MPSLINLAQYKTKSELQLADTHNQLIDALNFNFTYTLNHVTNSVPVTSLGKTSDVLYIKSNGTLGYTTVNDLISAQQIMNNLNGSPLRLNSQYFVNLLGNDGSLNSYSLNAGMPGGLTGDSVQFLQLDNTGHMQEKHIVTLFHVNANSGYINVNSGYFSINLLRVAGYAFPNNIPTNGNILRANALGNLEFQDLPQPIFLDTSDNKFKLSEGRPLYLQTTNYLSANIQFGSKFEVGYTDVSVSENPASFFKMSGRLIFTIEDVDVPYMRMYAGFSLPPASSIDPVSNPIGSLWYDDAQQNIVLISSTGKRYINPQAISQTVNTEDAKDFVLQPAATLSVSSGFESKPSLNIGSVGLVSTSESLKFVVFGEAVTKISNEGISSALVGSTGTAKILLDTQAAINNPVKPTYTFNEAEGLGLYRSDINAMAVSVKGTPIMEFSDKKVSLKGNKLSNVATPSEALDAANKQYVDARIPIGNTPGAMPTVDSSTGLYVESNAKYFGGKLEIGSISEPATFKLNSSSGGSVTIKVPATSNNTVFNLPDNELANGVLQYINGESKWVSVESLTSNIVKSDGSTALSAGLRVNSNTTPSNPMINSNGLGVYAGVDVDKRIGFSANGTKVLEVNATTNILTGRSNINNAPLIRLTNSISSYSSDLGASGVPTYSFAGDNMTGIGQNKLQSLAMIVNGNSVISASSNGINAHLNRIQNVAYPLSITDVANKQYVDDVVKPKIEVSFRITSLPIGWEAGASIILSIYDSALIYQSASANLIYESASDKTKVLVPTNFVVNPYCQVYLNNERLVKMASVSGVRQVTYATSKSILINYNLGVGDIITIHLPS